VQAYLKSTFNTLKLHHDWLRRLVASLRISAQGHHRHLEQKLW
jgi:hypothetical protein